MFFDSVIFFLLLLSSIWSFVVVLWNKTYDRRFQSSTKKNPAENTMKTKTTKREELNKNIIWFFFHSPQLFRPGKSNYERSSSSLILHYAGSFFSLYITTARRLFCIKAFKKTFASVKRWFFLFHSVTFLFTIIDISFGTFSWNNAPKMSP